MYLVLCIYFFKFIRILFIANQEKIHLQSRRIGRKHAFRLLVFVSILAYIYWLGCNDLYIATLSIWCWLVVLLCSDGSKFDFFVLSFVPGFFYFLFFSIRVPPPSLFYFSTSSSRYIPLSSSSLSPPPVAFFSSPFIQLTLFCECGVALISS